MAVTALKEMREARGLSAVSVSKDLGISRKTLNRHEAQDVMKLARLIRLGYSAYYGVPIDALEEVAA